MQAVELSGDSLRWCPCSPLLFYFPQPARMAWQDWKKPGKVMLFDSDASFNYILAFITKSKKTQKSKKKKDGEGK